MTTTPRSLLLLVLLSVFLELLALAQSGNHFIYNGFHNAKLHLDGLAEIYPNGLLRITNTSTQQSGHAFYNQSLNFNNSSLSFSTNFVFAMVHDSSNSGGHGLTFVISPSMNFNQAVAIQYFGLFNASNNGISSNHIFAVEFDTYANTEFEDINNNHVGIDVNGLKSVAAAPAAYYSGKDRVNKSLELGSGSPLHVWIDYDDAGKHLNVTVAPTKIPKPIQPLLSTTVDLSRVLLESMYVGFSASTGSMFLSNHYILGWSFNGSGQAEILDDSNLPSFPRARISKGRLDLHFTVLIISVSVMVIAITVAAYVIRMRKYKEIREDWELEYGPQRFSYKELYKATKGFRDRELLGSGGFGKVYRGVLSSSGAEVAVKKVSHSSTQGMKEFVAEIASMGRLRHRNLVGLLGYCRRRGELLLVYDYMPNGSLDKFLFSNEKQSNLSWDQRYRILRGIASGLLYLHEEWEQVVLHRDVKASNVLIDAELNGRLGDFGLARLYDHGTNPQTTHVVGTIGYLAPELTRTGKATTGTDVFAFGIFMLEVACGRKPVELQGSPEDMILVEWVLEQWKKGDILETSDPRLGGNYVVEEMDLVLKLGLLCSHYNPIARPTMRQVMQYLDGDAIPTELLMSASCDRMAEMNSYMASFPSSLGKSSSHFLSSSESILNSGR